MFKKLIRIYSWLIQVPHLSTETNESYHRKQSVCSFLLLGILGLVCLFAVTLFYQQFLVSLNLLVCILHVMLCFGFLRLWGRGATYSVYANCLLAHIAAFANTILLGGFFSSGGIYLWASASPLLISLSSRGQKKAVFLSFLLFLLLLGISIAWQNPSFMPTRGGYSLTQILAFFNIGMFTLIVLVSTSVLVERLAKASAELRAANHNLEIRVQQRTAELAYVNTELRFEVQGRERAEKALIESEQQLHHSQKMESLGRLTGGIAHDFNNMLTVILSYCELSLETVSESEPMHKYVGEIHNAAQRASKLTRQLLAFGRRQIFELSVFSFNDLITDMQPMLERLVGENINFRVNLQPELAPVQVDRNQLEQVLMNLVVNALDAMPDGGTLTLTTDQISVEQNQAKKIPELSSGTYAVFSVRDTGCGMDPSVRAHIFEPFFTTKALGKGTGLGLATAYGIIRQSRGMIDVRSKPNEGTVIDVYLPTSEQTSTKKITKKLSPIPANGKKTILISEDEPQVREIIQSILMRKGYHVLSAANGEEALKLSASYSGPIHLLLTDFAMPQMNGQQLALLMQKARPQLQVLYMSGYANDMVRTITSTQEKFNLLQKPVQSSTLLERVQKMV